MQVDAAKEHENGVTIDIKVIPGSSRKGVRVIEGQRIVVSVHSSPEKGKANKETIKLLSKTLGVPLSRLEIIKGERARQKTILIKDMGIKQAENLLSPHFISTT